MFHVLPPGAADFHTLTEAVNGAENGRSKDAKRKKKKKNVLNGSVIQGAGNSEVFLTALALCHFPLQTSEDRTKNPLFVLFPLDDISSGATARFILGFSMAPSSSSPLLPPSSPPL